MKNDGGCVDVHKLCDTLLEILPRLMESFVAQRRYVKQASVLGSLSVYLHVMQGHIDDLSPEVMDELEMICTVSTTFVRRHKPAH
jgi:hypothetical protein